MKCFRKSWSGPSLCVPERKASARRTAPPFDVDGEKADRALAVEATQAQQMAGMHVPVREHLKPNPFGARPRTLGQLRGHLTELRVVCPLCHRQGIYHLEKQIEKNGRDCTILDWMMIITRDCKVLAETLENCAEGMVDMSAREIPPLLIELPGGHSCHRLTGNKIWRHWG